MPTSKIASWGVVDRSLSERESWISFFAVFCFCSTTTYLQNKVASIITVLAAAFTMDPASAGYLVASFAIVGIVLAFPAAWIMRKLGVKTTLILAGCISIIGSLIGLFAQSAATILFSRVLEGCGMAFAAVVGPNVIPRLFPQEKMGLVMGVWSCWTLPGIILAFITTPLLYEAFGYRSLWVLSLVLEIATTAWMILSFRLSAPASSESVDAVGARSARKPHVLSAWLVAFAFLGYGLLFGTILAYYPTYLQTVKGVSLTLSSIVPMVLAVTTAPFGIWFGILADRHRARKWFIVIPLLVVAALEFTIGFTEGPELWPVWLYAVIFGICCGGIPMGIYALVPLLAVERSKADYALAGTGFFMMISNFMLGPLGTLITDIGYHQLGMYVLAPVALFFAILVLVCKGDRD